MAVRRDKENYYLDIAQTVLERGYLSAPEFWSYYRQQ